MRPTAEIFTAAVAEMERLPATDLSVKQALAYRDALMLALLAARPLRVKNFTALELRRHLVGTEGGLAHLDSGRGDQDPSAGHLRPAGTSSAVVRALSP
jgi:hypothetical protein